MGTVVVAIVTTITTIISIASTSRFGDPRGLVRRRSGVRFLPEALSSGNPTVQIDWITASSPKITPRGTARTRHLDGRASALNELSRSVRDRRRDIAQSWGSF